MQVGELIESVSPAAIRLAPGQSLQAWLSEHGTGKMDIVGGAYSAAFVGLAGR